jgi:hypothetical protein
MKRVNLINLTMRELSLIIISQMHAGKSRQEMVAYLRQRGWPDASAQRFIANVLSQSAPMAHTDADTDGDEPLSALALWLCTVIGLALIGFSLIASLPF